DAEHARQTDQLYRIDAALLLLDLCDEGLWPSKCVSDLLLTKSRRFSAVHQHRNKGSICGAVQRRDTAPLHWTAHASGANPIFGLFHNRLGECDAGCDGYSVATMEDVASRIRPHRWRHASDGAVVDVRQQPS